MSLCKTKFAILDRVQACQTCLKSSESKNTFYKREKCDRNINCYKVTRGCCKCFYVLVQAFSTFVVVVSDIQPTFSFKFPHKILYK